MKRDAYREGKPDINSSEAKSGDLKQTAKDAWNGSWSYSSKYDQFEQLLYCNVESKWKNYQIVTVLDSLLPKPGTKSRSFLWRKNNPEVHYSRIQISSWECF